MLPVKKKVVSVWIIPTRKKTGFLIISRIIAPKKLMFLELICYVTIFWFYSSDFLSIAFFPSLYPPFSFFALSPLLSLTLSLTHSS